MGRHNREEPRTGDGKTRGKKIHKTQVGVQTSNGAWLWKQIATLWGDKKKK